MANDKSIDIYVVSYNHEAFVCRNVSLARQQNPGTKINWFIGVTGHMESFFSVKDDPSVHIVNDIGFPKDNQHMRCMLHLLTNYGSSRYKLMLDPDFYLIQDNWISRCISEIEAANSGCVATQWHPSWRKQRWGLAPHFLLYDTTKITITRKDVFPTRSFRAIYNVDSGIQCALLKGLELLLAYMQRLDQIITGGRVMRVSDTCAGLSWRLYKANIGVLRLAIHFDPESIIRPKELGINRRRFANRLSNYLKKLVSPLFIDSPYGPHYWTAKIDETLAKFPGDPELHYLGHEPFGVHARRYGRNELSISAPDLLELVSFIRELSRS